MIISIQFKTPDALEYAIDREFGSECEQGEMNDEESEREFQKEEARVACEKFVEYGEYCTIQIDTEKGTAIVVPIK